MYKVIRNQMKCIYVPGNFGPYEGRKLNLESSLESKMDLNFSILLVLNVNRAMWTGEKTLLIAEWTRIECKMEEDYGRMST